MDWELNKSYDYIQDQKAKGKAGIYLRIGMFEQNQARGCDHSCYQNKEGQNEYGIFLGPERQAYKFSNQSSNGS